MTVMDRARTGFAKACAFFTGEEPVRLEWECSLASTLERFACVQKHIASPLASAARMRVWLRGGCLKISSDRYLLGFFPLVNTYVFSGLVSGNAERTTIRGHIRLKWPLRAGFGVWFVGLTIWMTVMAMAAFGSLLGMFELQIPGGAVAPLGFGIALLFFGLLILLALRALGLRNKISLLADLASMQPESTKPT